MECQWLVDLITKQNSMMFVTIFPLVLISKLATLPRAWLLSMPFAFSESSFLLYSHGQTVGNWSCSCCSCLVNKPKCFSAGSWRPRTGGRCPRCPEHSFSGDHHSQVPTRTHPQLWTWTPPPVLHPRHFTCLTLALATAGIIAALGIEEKGSEVEKNSINLWQW